MSPLIALFIFLIFSASTCQDILPRAIVTTGSGVDIGVCYGMVGNNLPAPLEVVKLYIRHGIAKMRLFDPKPEVLEALKGSGIQLSLGVPNGDLPTIANSPEGARSWFSKNIEPYRQGIEIGYIVVGNEAMPGQFGSYVGPAMQNLKDVLLQNQLTGIQVTTAVSMVVLGASYPPSSGAFGDDAAAGMRYILPFLAKYGAPIMLNVYPYFAYAADPTHVRLDYAQFTATSPVVQDGNLSYYNLFDAMVDSVIAAMEKMEFPNTPVAISESGWPSAGNGNLTTPQLAMTYNKNFMNHIIKNQGTPRRPNTHTDAYMFAMFNENLKPNGQEQHFGLFYPNMNPVYPIF